jgi:hypothetical protein
LASFNSLHRDCLPTFTSFRYFHALTTFALVHCFHAPISYVFTVFLFIHQLSHFLYFYFWLMLHLSKMLYSITWLNFFLVQYKRNIQCRFIFLFNNFTFFSRFFHHLTFYSHVKVHLYNDHISVL